MSQLIVKNTYETRHYNDQGKLHRENGPAVEKDNGDKEWWINGFSYIW